MHPRCDNVKELCSYWSMLSQYCYFRVESNTAYINMCLYNKC